MILETVVTTINPDGSVNCGAMGVEWGEARIVIKPYRGTRTLRNLRATGAAVVNLTDDILLFSQAALGDPHPPTRPATSVEGAVLDDACSWREVRVRGDRRQRRARRRHHGGRRGGTGPRVPRPQPGAPRGARGLDPRVARAPARRRRHPRRAEPPAAARRQDRRAAEREAMAYVTAPCARRWATCDAGARRGAGAPASRACSRSPATARGASAGSAWRSAGPASWSRRGRPTSCPPRAPTPSARWRSRAAAARRSGSRAARTCAWSRRSRRTSGSARARSSRSPSPRRWRRWRIARSTRRSWPRRPAAPRAPRWACGRSRSAASWSRAGVRRDVERPAPLLARYPMPDEWRVVLVVPRPSRGCPGPPRMRRSGGSCRRPSARRTIAQLVLTVAAAGARRARPRGVRRRAHAHPAARRRRVRRGAGRALPPARRRARRGAAALRGGGRRPELVGTGRLRGRRQRGGRARARAPHGGVVGGEGSVELVTFDNRGARVERS